MDAKTLGRLLDRSGSYPLLAEAAASGDLHSLLPIRLFDHIGAVYDRVERLAGDACAGVEGLRLATLLHEQRPDSLPSVLAAASLSDYEPLVVGVITGFGRLWKARRESDIARYTVAEREHLGPLLLFELAHEGYVTAQMALAARLGGLGPTFVEWVGRLPAEERLVRVRSVGGPPARLR